jgi:hypothetical protein
VEPRVRSDAWRPLLYDITKLICKLSRQRITASSADDTFFPSSRHLCRNIQRGQATWGVRSCFYILLVMYTTHERELLALLSQYTDGAVAWTIGVPFPTGGGIFSLGHRLQNERLWGPPSFLTNGCWGALSPKVKRPGRAADHSPPSTAEVKNAWSSTSN